MAAPQHQRPLSSLPSTRARALAFAAILVGGACGGVIGFSVADISCTGTCSVQEGLGALVGAVAAAAGVAVVAVLALRAMGEWKRLGDDQLDGPNPAP